MDVEIFHHYCEVNRFGALLQRSPGIMANPQKLRQQITEATSPTKVSADQAYKPR